MNSLRHFNSVNLFYNLTHSTPNNYNILYSKHDEVISNLLQHMLEKSFVI